VAEPRIGDKIIDENEITRALLFIVLFIGVIVVSWLVFLYYGYPPLQALFEVTSAAATVGLSSGVTSTELPTALKIVLCTDMLLGRLEIIALLVVLYPPTWIGKRKQ
jgi:trk system potassium uptake protein TrkH